MKNTKIKNSFFVLSSVLCATILLFVNGCSSWMSSDGFFENVESQVKVANAERISVFVRYANTKEGDTIPNLSSTQKVDVPFQVSATTSDNYAFVKWAAFSSKDFATNQQHSSLLFVDEADYNEKFKKYELSSSEVKFSNIKSATTNATVKKNRNDVFIIPVVCARPVYVTSNPENGAENQVINMSVRILFSKPIKPASVKGNITISQGARTITDATSDFEDVTDKYEEPEVSVSGKLVTIKQKTPDIEAGEKVNKYYLTPNQKIIVQIGNEIEDVLGNTMADSASFSFYTNGSIDNVAPKITELEVSSKQKSYDSGYTGDFSAGIGFEVVDSVKKDKMSLNSFESAMTGEVSNKIFAQRTDGKLFMHIRSQDYTSSDASATGVDDIGSIVNVKAYKIANVDGTAADDGYVTNTSYFIYDNGTCFGADDNDFNNGGETNGLSIIYNLRTSVPSALPNGETEMPDGLYRVDVWAVDTIGNEGSGDRVKSFYVVLDNTSPDAGTEVSKVETVEIAGEAPYHWFNEKSIEKLKVRQSDFESSPIIDSGDSRLSSKPENIKWSFSLDSGKNWTDWGLAKNEYSIENASSIAVDGALKILVRFMDDLGNISESAELNSINYDNTKPVINDLSWVNSSGDEVVGATSLAYMDDSFSVKVPYIEKLSGIKEIFVTVTDKDNAQIPQDKISFRLSENKSTAVMSASGNVLDDAIFSTQNPCFYIYGIKPGNSEGVYTVHVTVNDSAINKAAEKTVSLIRDSTNPVVDKVEIENLKKRVVYSDSKESYWLDKSCINSSTLKADKATIVITATEESSGIAKIILSENIMLTDSSRLMVEKSGSYTSVTTEVVYNTSSNTIELSNYKNPLLRGAGVKFKISNVEFAKTNVATGNSISVDLEDFVELKCVSACKTVTCDGKTGISSIFVDSIVPEIKTLKLLDGENNTVTNPKSISYTTDCTDSNIIDASVCFVSEENTGSGVNSISISSGASFIPADTKVFVDGTEVTARCQISDTKILFKDFSIINDTNVVTVKNLKLSDSTDGTKNVAMTVADLAGWTSTSKTTASIVLDTVAPKITDVQWTSQNGTPGITKGNVLEDQTLHISYTEATSGLNFIKVEIFYESEGICYADPFASSLFEIKNGTTVVASNETKASEDSTCVKLTSRQKTGTLDVFKLTISNSPTPAEGRYNVKVSLVDASENCDLNSIATAVISNDSTAPVVQKVEIPGLYKSTELNYTEVAVRESESQYWLDSRYAGGDGNGNYAPTKVPVYVTINESTSGVKEFKFGGTMKIQTSTTLWKVSPDGTETQIPSAKYTISTSGNSLTIKNQSDVFVNDEGAENFKVLFKDMAFKNKGGQETDSASNSVSVKVSDVALNVSAENKKITLKDTTTKIDSFWSDTWNCGTKNLILKNSKIVKNKNEYDNQYTSSELINVVLSFGAENCGASGVNKFILLDGALFTSDTTVSYALKTGSDGWSNSETLLIDRGTSIPNTKFEISEDKTTITLKDADTYYVFRNLGSIMFTNVKISDSAKEGTKTVSAVCADLAGWTVLKEKKTQSIVLDKTKPLFKGATKDSPASGKSVYTAAYTYYSSGDSINNIYPHSNSASNEGLIIDPDLKNADGVTIRYVYSSACIGEDTEAVLGIDGSDENLINGYLYLKHSSLDEAKNCTAEKVVSNTNSQAPDTDAKGDYIYDNTLKVRSYWQNFETGYYSAVLVDAAGNYSPAYTFCVVEDKTAPCKTVDGSAYSTSSEKSLSRLMTMVVPDENSFVFHVEKIENYTNTCSSIAAGEVNLSEEGFDFASATANTQVIKKASGKYKVVVKLGTGTTPSDMLLKGEAAATTQAYSEACPTAAASPLDSYSISHRYRQWYYSETLKAPTTNAYSYLPYFPSTTGSVNGQTVMDLFPSSGSSEGVTGLTKKISWHSYEKSTARFTDDGIVSYVDENKNIVIEIPDTESVCPPLTLLLRDGCGNLQYMQIKPDTLESYGTLALAWRIDGMVSSDSTYSLKNRHVGTVPYMASSKQPDYRANTEGPKGIAVTGTETAIGYYWGNRTSSYQAENSGVNDRYDGQNYTGVQVRNKTGKVTYYNAKAYIGLFVCSETCKFETRSQRSSAFPDGKGFTVRARILAWDAEKSAPTVNDFDGEGGEGTDFSSWIYLRDNSTANNDMTLQYPHPVRTTPYKLYYFVQDGVGNYEINTIENGKTDGDYNLWMYDNEGPSVKVRTTQVSPDAITGSEISTLMPYHNGGRAYFDSTAGIGYVYHCETSKNYADPELGNGVIIGCLNVGDRKYYPYFDLDISEISGIRAFSYSRTSTVPTVRANAAAKTETTYGSTMGDKEGYWYAGKDGIDLEKEIGEAFTYAASSDGKKMLKKGKVSVSTDNYLDGVTDTYSGVKVVATVPRDIDVMTDPSDLYLHVMDWVGNITTVKLGSNIKWQKDYNSTTYNDNYAGEHAENYYVEPTTSSGTTVVFAAAKPEISEATDIRLYLPEGKYKEYVGEGGHSGIYGWSRTANDISKVLTDEKGSYIALTQAEISAIKNGDSAQSFTGYVYDNVGFNNPVALNVSGDAAAPEFTLLERGNDGVYSPSYVKDDDKYYAVTGGDDRNGILTNIQVSVTPLTDVSGITSKAYVKTPGFDILLSGKPAGNNFDEDIYEFEIRRWNGTSWGENIFASKKYSEMSENVSGSWWKEPDYITTPKISFEASDTEEYYQAAVYDNAGNVSYAHFVMTRDTKPPVASVSAIEDMTKAKVNSTGSINYYNAASTVDVTVQDPYSGIGKVNGSAVSGYKNETSLKDFKLSEISVSTSEHKLQLAVEDNLKTSANTDISYNGISSWVYDNTAPVASNMEVQDLSRYNGYYGEQGSKSSTNFEFVSYDISNYKTAKLTTKKSSDETNTLYVAFSNVRKFKFKMPSVVDANHYGWYITTGELAAGNNWMVLSDALVTSDDYLFDSIPEDGAEYYFYPVDKAGNVGKYARLIFKTPVVPTLSNFSNKEIKTVSNVIYFNSNSYISARVSNPSRNEDISIVSYTITDGTNTATTDLAEPLVIAKSGSKDITLSLKDLSEETVTQAQLTVYVSTAETSGTSTINGKWTSKTTGPSLDSVKVEGVGQENVKDSYVYYKSTSKVDLSSVQDVLGVAGFAVDTNPSVNESTVWSTNKKLSIPSVDGKEVYVHSKDGLGNVSSKALSVSDKTLWVCDDTPPSPVSSVSLSVSDGEGVFWDAENKKLYFNSSVSSLTLTFDSYDSDETFYGISAGDNVSAGNAVTLNPNTAGSSLSFFAVDYAGNRSVSGYAISFVSDNDGPKPNSLSDNNRVINWTMTTETGLGISSGYDLDHIGSDYYETNFYPSDMKVSISCSETGSGFAAYCLKKGTSDSVAPQVSAEDFTAVSNGSLTGLTFDPPDYHGYEWLFLKDKVGNVSSYLISNPNDKWLTWMREYAPLAESTVQAAFQAGTLVLTGISSQSPVKKITVTGEGLGMSNQGVDWQHQTPKVIVYDSNRSSKEITYTYDSENKVVTLNNAYVVTFGRIEVHFNYTESSVTSVVVEDLNGSTVTVSDIAIEIPALNMSAGVRIASTISKGVEYAVGRISTFVSNATRPKVRSIDLTHSVQNSVPVSVDVTAGSVETTMEKTVEPAVKEETKKVENKAKDLKRQREELLAWSNSMEESKGSLVLDSAAERRTVAEETLKEQVSATEDVSVAVKEAQNSCSPAGNACVNKLIFAITLVIFAIIASFSVVFIKKVRKNSK